MVFTLFFFFRDGDRMYRVAASVIPMDSVHKDAIFRRLYDTLSAVMRGMVVTAVVQGVLTWIGLAVLAVPYAAFLGVVVGHAVAPAARRLGGGVDPVRHVSRG